MISQFTNLILDWYSENARKLPWRGHPDPYAVWVSEIMLQQTRVETVIPYFQRWMNRFPTLTALANAPQQDVLNMWEGLGYYSRARNLHRAADTIIKEYNGEIPQDRKTLTKLPGIGRYTAAAIASIAFGKDEPGLDGNIRRVLSRVFNISDPPGSTSGERKLWALAEEHLPSGQAGRFNQAMMDLGATICTPKNPDCQNCPVKQLCQAKALDIQGERPIPKIRPSIPHHTVTAAVIQQGNKVMIVQRPQDGLLGGLWEFPGGKLEPGEDLPACLRREICEELGVEIHVGEPFGTYKHAYSHFRVTLHAYLCTLNGDQIQLKEHSDLRWVTPADLDEFPMGKIDRQIASKLQQTSQVK
jgi:A/G-specific adenine glycosylase